MYSLNQALVRLALIAIFIIFIIVVLRAEINILIRLTQYVAATDAVESNWRGYRPSVHLVMVILVVHEADDVLQAHPLVQFVALH